MLAFVDRVVGVSLEMEVCVHVAVEPTDEENGQKEEERGGVPPGMAPRNKFFEREEEEECRKSTLSTFKGTCKYVLCSCPYFYLLEMKDWSLIQGDRKVPSSINLPFSHSGGLSLSDLFIVFTAHISLVYPSPLTIKTSAMQQS